MLAYAFYSTFSDFIGSSYYSSHCYALHLGKLFWLLLVIHAKQWNFQELGSIRLLQFTTLFLPNKNRIVTVVYIHHIGAKGILDQRKTQHFTYNPDDPLQSIKVLGLNLGKTGEKHTSTFYISYLLHCMLKLYTHRTCTIIFFYFLFAGYFPLLLLP